MAKSERTKSKASKSKPNRESILSEFKRYVLLNGEKPNSVFQFVDELGWSEDQFYDHFSSFESMERLIWKDYFLQVHAVLNKDKSFAEYSVREKMLSFYYTMIEALKRERSYVKYCFETVREGELNPYFLKDLKDEFKIFVEALIAEGMESGEILKRPVVSKRYFDGIWLQFLFVMRFWIKDSSNGFEQTDAAIEKAVHLSFELMGKGPLDSMIDFGKFLFKSSQR